MDSTLMEELVSQLRVNNPNASPEEIAEGVASILSKEILPAVLKNLALPKFPTVREEIQEAKKIRGLQGSKIDKVNTVSRRRSLIQQVERVRTEMGWDGIDDTLPTAQIIDANSVYFPKNFTISKNEKNKKKIELDKEKLKDNEVQEETINTTAQKLQILDDKNIIALSESTQRKIVSEPIFETFFERAEIKMRAMIAIREPGTFVDVSCDPDEEAPNRTKCIIKVHPPANLDFKQRMKLSTIFDIIIRKEIKNLKENATSENLQELQNINRNIFVHVDL